MDLRESMSNLTDVSLTLATHILSTTEAKDSNAVFSPLSIQVILGLIAAGSNGPTQAELLSFLKSKSIDDVNNLTSQLVNGVFSDGSSVGGPQLSFANGVWVDQSMPFKPSFKKVVDDVYKAAAYQVDFQTKHVEVTKEVNQWAENKTNGLIKEILPSDAVDCDTRLILANALYFKGVWDEKFDASMTKDHAFHLLDGTSVQVPFMTSMNRQCICAFDSFKVLTLNYKLGDDNRLFSMSIFLPNAKDGLADLVNKISSEPRFLDRHLMYRQAKVTKFLVPKFKMSFGFNANEVLQGLGLVSLFSAGDLTEMVESLEERSLHVSGIIHKSFIEVSEEGTEAAAATVGVISSHCLVRREKLDFVADHPFLFLIRENMSGALLFLGQVLNPLDNSA